MRSKYFLIILSLFIAFFIMQPTLIAQELAEETQDIRSVWLTCNVHGAGPAEDGNVYIRLSDISASPAFPGQQWFKAHITIKEMMLTTTLTAIDTSKVVRVLLTNTTTYSTINRLYIMK